MGANGLAACLRHPHGCLCEGEFLCDHPTDFVVCSDTRAACRRNRLALCARPQQFLDPAGNVPDRRLLPAPDKQCGPDPEDAP